MSANLLTHEHLQTIIAAENCRSMGAIAQTIHVSQPTITRRCNEIEDAVGQTIFIRKKNNLSLTRAGFVLLEYAKSTVASHQRMMEALSELKNGQTVLHIGASPSVTIDDAIVVADELFMRHSIVTHIREAEPTQLIDMLHEGRIELALLWGNHHVSGISFTPYKRENIVLLTQITHPLAALGRAINFEEAEGSMLIDIIRPSVIGDFLYKVQESTSVRLQPMIVVTSLEAAAHAVSVTHAAITITLESTARRFCQMYPHLQTVRLRDSWAHTEYCEAYVDIGALSNAGVEFLRCLKIKHSHS
jgi:DNA-binding transcriptional LysR family regulator